MYVYLCYITTSYYYMRDIIIILCMCVHVSYHSVRIAMCVYRVMLALSLRLPAFAPAASAAARGAPETGGI